MNHLYPIKFAFGSSVPSDILSGQIEYYQKYFSDFLKKEYTLNEALAGDFKTIPIDENSAQFSSTVVKEFNNALTNTFKIIEDSKFKTEDDIVIIDLRGIIKLLTLLHLTNEIAAILKNEVADNTNTRFALILESIEENDKVLIPIKPYIEKKKVFVIDLKRRFLFGNLEPSINANFDFDSITKSPIEKIRYKLIRRIGHFERVLNGKHVACNQYFYDGTYCISDVKDLIVRKVIDLKEKESFNPTLIVYHCPESHWLAEAIYKTDGELLRIKSLHQLQYKSKSDLLELTDNDESQNKILFIVALVHSGETFKGIFKDITKKFPSSQIKSISILHSGSTSEYEIYNNIRKIEFPPSRTENIEFFLQVEQKNYPVVLKECPMCNYDLFPKVDSTYLGKDDLPSYEMWLICDNAGYIKEDFPPTKNRKIMDLKPNSIKMMKDNAAYLAFKFDNLITKQNLKKSSELIFVFPDETSNELEIQKREGKPILQNETPSGYFAECLRQLKDFQYFPIPRSIIQLLQKAEIKLSDISTHDPYFYKRLRKLPEDIILFDEFNNSGGTVLTMIKILKLVNRSPLAYFPIFNFSPSKNLDLGDIKTLSLYQFDLEPNIADA